MIYAYEKAFDKYIYNLKNRTDRILGYFKENNYSIAFDNTSLEMFLEEFKNEKDAIAWVNGFDNIFDGKIRVKRLLNNIVYVSGGNFIKIKIEDGEMYSVILTVGIINSIKEQWCKIIKYIANIHIESKIFIENTIRFIRL